MSQKVQDFAHYVCICLAALLVAGGAVYLALYSWHVGDGQAEAFAGAVQPLLIGVFSSLTVLLLGNLGANALVAIKTAQANAQAQAAQSVSSSAVVVPAQVVPAQVVQTSTAAAPAPATPTGFVVPASATPPPVGA